MKFYSCGCVTNDKNQHSVLDLSGHELSCLEFGKEIRRDMHRRFTDEESYASFVKRHVSQYAVIEELSENALEDPRTRARALSLVHNREELHREWDSLLLGLLDEVIDDTGDVDRHLIRDMVGLYRKARQQFWYS